MDSCISVIVPVYNAEGYLTRCLDSIINQTYSNLEIILIDDGSSDGSGIVCDMYSDKDPRIKVIHQNNCGVSSARNAGIDSSTGDYLAFVDSDDYLGDDYIYNLYNVSIKYDADISYSFSSGGGYEDGVINSREALRNICLRRYVGGAPWGKLFRRTLFTDLYFPVGMQLGEDMYLLVDLFLKAKRIAWTNRGGYFYQTTENSLSSSLTKEKIAHFNICHKYFRTRILEQFPELHEEVSVRCATDSMWYILNYIIYWDSYKEEYCKLRRIYLNDWKVAMKSNLTRKGDREKAMAACLNGTIYRVVVKLYKTYKKKANYKAGN